MSIQAAYGAPATVTITMVGTTSGLPVPVTGWTARADIEKFDDATTWAPALALSNAAIANGGAAGTLTLALTGAQTAALASSFGSPMPTRRGRLSFYATPSGGTEELLFQGELELLPAGSAVQPYSVSVADDSLTVNVSAIVTQGPQGPAGEMSPSQLAELDAATDYVASRNPPVIYVNEPNASGVVLNGDNVYEGVSIAALEAYIATLTDGCKLVFKAGDYRGFDNFKRPQFCSIEGIPGATFFIRDRVDGCGWVMIDESYVNIGQPWDSTVFGITFKNEVTSDATLGYCQAWQASHVYTASDVTTGLIVRDPDYFALCALKLVQAGTSGAVHPIGELSRLVKSPGVELRGIATANHGLIVRINVPGAIGSFTVDVSTNGGSSWNTNGGGGFPVTAGSGDNIKYGILWNVPSSFGLGAGLYVWFPCWNTGIYTAGLVIYPKPRVELVGTPTCAWQIHDFVGTVDGQLGTFAFKAGSTMAASASLTTIGTGSKTLTIATGLKIETDAATLPFFARSGAGTMTGTVTSYNSSTGAIVANITSVTGAGSSSSWTVYWGAYERHKHGNTVVLESSAHTSGAPVTTASGTYWDYALDANLTVRFHAGYYSNPDATWDYLTPHGWSHAIGTRIADGTAVWEVQPVNGGFLSNVAGGTTIESCGSIGGHIGLAVNQSEGFKLCDGRWSGAAAAEWWFTNDGALTPGAAGSFTNANSVEGQHIMSTESVGVIHDGGNGFKVSGAITLQRCQLAWGHLAGLLGSEFKNKYQETSRAKIRDTAYFSRQSVGFSFKGLAFRASNMVGASSAPACLDVYNGDGLLVDTCFLTGTTAGVKLSGTTRGVRIDQTNTHNAGGLLASTYAPVSQILLGDHMLDTIPRVHPPAIVSATNGTNADLQFFGECILLTGPSAGFSLTGLRPKKFDGTLLATPYEGQEVLVMFSAGYPALCTVTHDNAASTSGFRTRTITGQSVVINPRTTVGMPWMRFKWLWPGTVFAGWYLIAHSGECVDTVALTDADATLTVAGGRSYSWSTLTRNVAITLGTSAAYHDAEFELIRYDTNAFTITVTGAVTKTMPVSTQAWQRWRYDAGASTWRLKAWASG